MSRIFLGFDTSAYTTSIAAVDENRNVVLDLRKMLEVKAGAKGLRQQDAVFQHVNNIPLLIEEASRQIDFKKVFSITVSTRPRNIEGSYMPVFKVGEGHAYVLSKALGVEYNITSHQDGHIGSIYTDENIDEKDLKSFLALHISGGTTELLMVEDKGKGYDIVIVGGTKDISAGQLIDRIGVRMGLRFPCGKEIDELSQAGDIIKGFPISTNNTWLNFSGTETYFQRLIENDSYGYHSIARSLLHSIAYSLKEIILSAFKEYYAKKIIVTGGVSANRYIREVLQGICYTEDCDIYFPHIKYSTDNAVGVAYIGSRIWRKNNGNESIKG